jgi:hypothetical protein
MQTYAHFAVLSQCTVLYMKDLHRPNQSVTFSLRGKQIRPMDLTILATQLHQMDFTKRLTVLDLSRNLITPSGVSTLMEEIVTQIPSLTELNLGENPLLSDQGVKLMIPFLGKSNIKVLNLARCGLHDRSARYFRNNGFLIKNLLHIDVSNNSIAYKGAKDLVGTLKHAHEFGTNVRAGMQADRGRMNAPAIRHGPTVTHHPPPLLTTTKHHCTQLYISYGGNERMTAKGLRLLQSTELELALLDTGESARG